MRARDLMKAARVAKPGDPATILIEAFADPDVRGVAVVTDVGELVGLITDQEMLGACLPSYVLDDEALARVLEEEAGARLSVRLGGKQVRDLIDETTREEAVVSPDDTLIEVAATMVRSRGPAIVVVEDKRVLGVITADVLLTALLSPGAK
jgi:CBS domain-containing protein